MESHCPIVGIAIPAYCASETLSETLRSCIAQTMSDWVAFVTVDGEDATQEAKIVTSLADPRIRLECNHRRIGQFANFNRAVLRCYGARVQWIKILCADDVLHRDALERMLEVGDRGPNCGLIFGYYNGIDELGQLTSEVDLRQTRSRIVKGRDFFLKALPLFNPIGGPSSVMFRADVIERCGLFDDRLNYSGEASLWYRIISRFDVGIVGEQAILDYRFHTNSVTGRGHVTADRFEQPIDIAREIAAQYSPFSREWWLAQRAISEVIAVNLITSAAFIRRGQWRLAVMSASVSLRRASLASPVITPFYFFLRLARVLLRLTPVRLGELAPLEIKKKVAPANRFRSDWEPG